jgi:hypothetical protein
MRRRFLIASMVLLIVLGLVANVTMGQVVPGSISGVKFADLNGNGVRDPGEP